MTNIEFKLVKNADVNIYITNYDGKKSEGFAG